VVSDLTDLLRRGVGEQVEIEARFEDLPLRVEADRGQLDQVVMNLVVNARDAMPNGGRITLEVRSSASAGASMPDDLDPQRDYVVLTVTDTGVGIADDVLALIFDPYFTTKELGNGLGLSTVYGIARKAGGCVTVTSTVGQGSCFHVFLPRISADDERAAAAPPPPARGRTARILLVEDQEELRHLFQLILEELGHQVVPASCGAEAITALERDQGRFDLLMTDLLMPRMNGLELARRARELITASMPVLFVSGWTDEKALAALDRGVHFLQKPFSSDDLGRAVEAALAAGEEAVVTAP
jgi:two-component system cell cycle sensor histidine kinase/response regulator CckA